MNIPVQVESFKIIGNPVSCVEYGNGHINLTLKLETDTGNKYILQRINKYVFKNPVKVVDNANGVTRFLREKTGDPNPENMKVDMGRFEAYTRGFLTAATALADKEVEVLPYGALIMTLEVGIRFLADYINGDVYFRTHYPEQNLVRCHTQLALAADMLKKWDEMNAIVAKIAKEVRGKKRILVVSVGEKGCTEPGSNTKAADIGYIKLLSAQEATKDSPNRAEVFTRPG